MKCSGCPFPTKAITGKGPKDSPFVIVGESPGSRELAMGIPFVGPSGQMLDSILQRVGFNSLGVKPYVINALNCYPVNKDLEKLAKGCKACNSRVLEDIKSHPRKVILTLGAAAAWSVTGDYGIKILSSRGQVIQKPELCSDGVVLAVHPAYLLRNGSGLSVWQKDLKQAVDLLKGQPLEKWTTPTWSVVEKPSDYSVIVDEYLDPGVPLITGDIETDAFDFIDGKMLMLGITKGDGSHVDIIPEKLLYSMPHLTKRLVENGRWNWQNGQFDIKFFRQLKMKANVHEDTMLLSYTLNENGGYHDLDQIAQHWLGAPKHKGMLDQYKGAGWKSYRDFPYDILCKYNAIDLSKTHCVHPILRSEVNSDPLLKGLYERLLIPAVDFVAEMELYGVKVNEETIRHNEVIHTQELDELRLELQAIAAPYLGYTLNPGSPKQLKELLYDKLGMGRRGSSTNEAALIDIQRKYDHPIVDLLLTYREVAKRKGTYVSNLIPQVGPKGVIKPGKIRSDGRIHASFKLHGTATGRLAGADPNLLNQPRGPLIRGQYVAAEGKIFVEVDLNQAELRSLTLMSEDKLLTEIYTENKISIHDVTTTAFYASKSDIMKGETDYERVRRMLHLDSKMEPSKVYGEAKMRGKAVNFGIVYGREAFSLAKEFNIPIAEAQRWIDTWLDTYNGAAKFIEWCRDSPAKKRTLITVYGRKKRLGVITAENIRALSNECANFPHQSTASDIMLDTAIEVYPVLRSHWDAWIWNEVYDAIYYELDADDTKIAESIEYVQTVITNVPKRRGLLSIPFLGDAKVGYDWGHMSDWAGSIEATLGKPKLTL